MAKRYKVATFGGLDGLKFPEIYVKFSGGYQLPLTVKEGEYVPLDILDPDDVKKSLAVGSLGRFIATGKIVVEDDDIVLPKPVVGPTPVAVPVVEVQEKVSEVVKEEVKPTVIKLEAVVEDKKETTPLNLSDVKTPEDFNRLGQFLKIQFVRECTDKALLQQILPKVDSPQLKNHITVRLTKLK